MKHKDPSEQLIAKRQALLEIRNEERVAQLELHRLNLEADKKQRDYERALQEFDKYYGDDV